MWTQNKLGGLLIMDNKEMNQFIEKDLQIYHDKLSTIVFTVDEIKDIVPKNKLSLRKYVRGTVLLSTYISKLKEAQNEVNKKGFFKSLFKSSNNKKCKKQLNDFKKEHDKEFKQIDLCLKCSCLKCIKNCTVNPCLFCNQSKVTYCNDNYVVIFPKERTETLERQNHVYTFNVLAFIFDIVKNKTYVLLEDQRDPSNRQMFYFINNTDKDEFECINSVKEIDRIASIFETALDEEAK